MSNNSKILLIGCGKMGGAILNSLIENKITDKKIIVVEPISENIKNFSESIITPYKDLKACLEKDFDVVILAIKPQSFEESLYGLNEYLSKKSIVISIAAGKSIETISKYTGAQAAIIRSMPNLPPMISQGITGYFCNTYVNFDQKELASKILASFGKVLELDDESDIDALTAISGSGPAYVFYILDLFIKSSQELGFTENQAQKLVFETFKGSIAMAEQNLNKKLSTLEQLRKDVTSKGGTTEAALNVLMNDDIIQNMLLKALKAARNRAEELSD